MSTKITNHPPAFPLVSSWARALVVSFSSAPSSLAYGGARSIARTAWTPLWITLTTPPLDPRMRTSLPPLLLPLHAWNRTK
ncbi:hypothetical protein MT325_m687L [Paramecium bursaria chlorella virus MT325]|uniref:Uncharacterized protein m687L n=1 Tax=Paramecium bursaria Chlorella virus MT325 TaxID=346932 RepID=A7IV67_PBCVM|nr:hypothetical protein MT325_m687L [Paramecium bursaria chlorella virus MT325]